MTTWNGQHLFSTTVLPQQAQVQVVGNEPTAGRFVTVALDPTVGRLRVDAVYRWPARFEDRVGR